MPVAHPVAKCLPITLLLLASVCAGAAPTPAEATREIDKLRRAGDSTQALARADAALQARPQDATLRFTRGVLLAELKRAAEAIPVFEALTQDYPDLPEPYNNLAVLHAGRGDWDAARTALEQSVRAVPSYALAHENLGDIHLQLAARAYERAGQLDPRNESARTKLGLARELVGRVQALPAPSSRTPRPGAQPQVTPR